MKEYDAFAQLPAGPVAPEEQNQPLGQTQPSGTHWGRILVVMGIVGAGVWWLSRQGDEEESESNEGWYTLLYKDEPRKGAAITDRLSTFEGPFPTKEEAQEVADREGDTWFAKVKHYSRLPTALAEW